MPSWRVDDRAELELDALDEIHLEITGGEASITAAPVPARLEIDRIKGGPVEVLCEHGVLRVMHRQRRLVRRRGGSEVCVVRLVVPPGARTNIAAVGATVVVSGLEGAVGVRTVSGRVYLHDVGGDLEVTTVSGDIEAVRLRGRVVARTVSGDLTANEVRCPSVEAHSVSGDFVVDSATPPTGVYAFKTVSGGVALRMPPEPGVDVQLRSVSGRVTSTFDLRPGREHGSCSSGDIAGAGGGPARIEVRTVSGRVALLERAAPA